MGKMTGNEFLVKGIARRRCRERSLDTQVRVSLIFLMKSISRIRWN